jgi:hypothetical protein
MMTLFKDFMSDHCGWFLKVPQKIYQIVCIKKRILML